MPDFMGLAGHALAGMMLGASLIIAIGAQNAFVLRQGLRRQHLGMVVLVCILCDSGLIIAGAYGLGGIITAHPAFTRGMAWFGAAFLLFYSAPAAKRALRPSALTISALQTEQQKIGTALTTVLAVSLLNPHVYLDTVILLGSIASQRTGEARLAFVIGAVFASTVWFTALGFGAKLLQPLFANPKSWQILDGLIAVMMALIAVSLMTG